MRTDQEDDMKIECEVNISASFCPTYSRCPVTIEASFIVKPPT